MKTLYAVPSVPVDLSRKWAFGAREREKPDRYRRSVKAPLIRQFTDWTVDDILAAQEAHTRGDFSQSGMLWLWMRQTSRLKASLRKRVNALSILPFCMEPATGEAEASPSQVAAAKVLEQEWINIFPESLQRSVLVTMIGMGAALCRVRWIDDGARWWPRLSLWPADAFYYSDTAQTWYARTREGADVVVKPGCGWVLFLPDGPLGFQSGSVLSLSIPCLLTALADTDWANYNAANAVVIRLAQVPRGATRTSKDEFLDNVEELGRTTSTLLCEKNLDGSGFGMEQLDPPTGNLDTFERAQSSAEKRITIEILGQEKTTDLGGEGARSAVEALQEVEDDLVLGDGRVISTTLHNQLLREVCRLNWGDESLAPYPAWGEDAGIDATDKAAGDKAIAEAAIAIDAALRGTGKMLDRLAYFERAGIPLIDSQGGI